MVAQTIQTISEVTAQLMKIAPDLSLAEKELKQAQAKFTALRLQAESLALQARRIDPDFDGLKDIVTIEEKPLIHIPNQHVFAEYMLRKMPVFVENAFAINTHVVQQNLAPFLNEEGILTGILQDNAVICRSNITG